MTSEGLAAIAATILSLAFSYLPGLAPKFDTLDVTTKRLIMGVLLLVVAGGAYAAGCGGLVDIGLVCGQVGAVELVKVVVAALTANQATYLLTKG